MTGRRWVRSAVRRLVRLAPLGLALLLAACSGGDLKQNTLDPAGPVAREDYNLFLVVFWIAVAIFVLVEGLVLLVALKFRQRSADQAEPKQIHGNARLEFGWTLAPALILMAISIPTVITIVDQAAPPPGDALTIKVVGHQWWWEYQYPDQKIVTANEMVIPVDREIFLELESVDVIHSFWVPRLAGKQDVVPERTNTLRLSATEPGQTYWGQCAEFCAISHANMRLRVVTKTQADFDAWVREQQAPAAAPGPGTIEARGKTLFEANACIQCHTTQTGGGANGVAPNLAHLASRGTFAGSIFDLNERELTAWVRDAPGQKPMFPPRIDPASPTTLIDAGNKGMPSFLNVLSDEELQAIVAYLLSLR